MKTCRKCKLELQESEFWIDHTSRDGLKSYCKYCGSKYNSNKKLTPEQKEKYNQKRKLNYEADKDGVRTKRLKYMEKWREENQIKTMYGQARIRARHKNIEFNIELSDINIPEVCPILEVPFSFKGKSWFSPSLDRIDVSKGYVKGNVAVISDLANTMKNSATLEQLKLFAKNIIPYISDDIVQP